MEKVYRYSSQKLINIQEFFDEYSSNLNINGWNLPKEKIEVTEIPDLSIDPDTISIEKHLSQDEDKKQFDYKPELLQHVKHKKGFTKDINIPIESSKLDTLKEVVKFKSEKSGNPFGMSPFSMKYFCKPQSKAEFQTPNLEPYSDVLISIRFYRPFHFKAKTVYIRPRFTEEFFVLGSNYLSQLKDCVSCISNNKRFEDISDNIHQKVQTTDDSSGFFFITDTFYNDMRNPKNSDYSEVIRKWAENRNSIKCSSFKKTANIEKTKFFDLNIQLGFPQVYQHNGNCEHVFVFSSIRLLSSDDCLVAEEYPILNSASFPNIRLCNMCARREYLFVVRNSNRQFHDPSYVCRFCLESFYYVEGKKVCDFQVYKLNPNADLDTDDEDTEELVIP